MASNQATLDALEAAEEQRNNRVVQDYYPFLKRLYIESEDMNVTHFKRALVIKKSGLNLLSLSDWPEVYLSQNTRLKK
jgi:hypothetical protein